MKIAHLSDLHFGRETPQVLEALKDKLKMLQPDLIIISGDFTQVANEAEFKQASAFLNDLSALVFCVPGNHDVPAFNLLQRFFRPYKLYKQFIHGDLCPVLKCENAHIVGLNSARRALPHWNWANGAISHKQRRFMSHSFADTEQDAWRICVLHHPIHKIDDMPIDVTVFGRKKTLALMEKLEVDLVLTGHVHHSSIMTRKNPENGHTGVYVSASTAISSRRRHHENGFHFIHLNNDKMQVENYVFDLGVFKSSGLFQHLK